MTRARALIAAALAGASLAGCGAAVDPAQRLAVAALAVRAAPVPATPVTPAVSCADPTASLRPTGLPAPGRLPAGSFMARIRARGYLIAGVDQNTLLFAYFDPLRGRIQGFEIDLLRRLAQALLGNPDAIQFKAITTGERVSAVQSGSVDVVADAMTITCARKRQVDFSTVYYDAGQRILVPTNSTARSVADLGGRRVCATAGSTSIAALAALRPRPIPYPVAQRTDCLVALQQGVVAAITSDDSILLGFRAQDPNTKLVGPRIADEPYGMAISHAHPDFVRFVNAVLEHLRADGTWRAIYARWLGALVHTIPVPPAPRYAR